MPAARRRKIQRKITLQSLISYPLIVIFVLLIANGLFDWINFNRGHRAFLNGNCVEAIRLFEWMIPGPGFLDPAKFSVLAQIEKDECLIYQQALDMQRDGNYRDAMLAYMNFVDSHPNSGLTEAVRIRTTALFIEAEPLDLVNETICQQTTTLLENRLIPQREIYLPLLYLGCAHFYDQTDQIEQTYSAYITFLSEYPEHEAGRDAEAGLLNNPLSCQKPNLFQDIPISKREDFMPKLYYTCGLDFETAGQYDNALQMFSTFLEGYPEHRFAGQMLDALARTLVAQAKSTNPEHLPLPLSTTRAAGGETMVLIQNNSPFELRIAFDGVQTLVDKLEICEGCQTYTEQTPTSCSTQIPAKQFMLSPGIYEVVIELASSEGKRFWLGEWELQEGKAYRTCFSVTEYP